MISTSTKLLIKTNLSHSFVHWVTPQMAELKLLEGQPNHDNSEESGMLTQYKASMIVIPHNPILSWKVASSSWM